MDSYEKLLIFLEIARMQDCNQIQLSVEEFPCLQKYARRLERHLGGSLTLLDKSPQFVIGYTEVLELDKFWNEVFGVVGFIYSLTHRSFLFRKCMYEGLKDYVPNPVDRAIHFVKELRRRGYL